MPKQKRSGGNSKSKISNFSEAEIEALEVGSRLDHRGKDGKARAGVVVEKKLNGKLLIKYDNVDIDEEGDDVYPDQVTVDPFSQLWAFASVGSLSASPPTAEYIKGFNPGDTIDVNIPIAMGWRMANIIKWSYDAAGEQLGQVMVEYEEYNVMKHFWLHIDNPEEVALPGQNSGGHRNPKIDHSIGQARNNRTRNRPTVLMVKNGAGKKTNRKISPQIQPGVSPVDQPGAQITSNHPTAAQTWRSSDSESPSKSLMPMLKKSSTKIVIQRKPLKRRTHAELQQFRTAEMQRINRELEASSALHRNLLKLKLSSLNRQQEESSCCETPSSDLDSKELFSMKGKQQKQSSPIKQTSYIKKGCTEMLSTNLSPDAREFIPRTCPSITGKPQCLPVSDKQEGPSLSDQQPEGQQRFPQHIADKKPSIGRFTRPPCVKTQKLEKPAQAPLKSSRFNRPCGNPPPVVKTQPQRLLSPSQTLPSSLEKDIQPPIENTIIVENVPGAPEIQGIPTQPQIHKPCVPYARNEPQPVVPATTFPIPKSHSSDHDAKNRLSTSSEKPSGDDCCEPNPNPNDIPLIWFDTDMLERGLHLDADERDKFLRSRALWQEEVRRRWEQEEYYRTSGYPSSQVGSYSSRDTNSDYGWRRNPGYYISTPSENYYQPQYQQRYREQRHSLYSVYGTPRRPQPLHEPSHRRSDFERQGFIREPQPQTREPLRPPPLPVTPTPAVHESLSPIRASARQLEGEPSPEVQREGEKENYVASSERLFDEDRIRASQGVG